MTVFRGLGTAIVLAMSSALLAPGAMAGHEYEQAPPPPPSRSTGSAWPDGFYSTLKLDMGDADDAGTTIGGTVKTDFTLGVGLGFGYRRGLVRMEAEYFSNYNRINDVDAIAGSPLAPGIDGGRIHVEGGMANFFVDLPGSDEIRPYLGVGLGITDIKVNYNNNDDCFLLFCSSTNEIVVDRDWAWAQQVMLGVSIRQEGRPMELSIGYRYFETEDLNFVTISGVPFIQDRLQSHSFTLGYRFPM